jgi:hypothetical protein
MMEIIVSTVALIVLALAAVVVATGGRPMRSLAAAASRRETLWRNRWPILWISLCVILTAGFLYWFYMPPAAARGPVQPIAFSHRLHVNVKAIQCEFCHPYAGRSNHPGLPPVEKCLYCHNHIIANFPEIRKEHAYFDTVTPTPWRKVFYLPEHVLFNHQRHIRKEIACQNCHGAVEQQDRLTGEPFRMGFCVECHRTRNANLDCWLACHN